MYVCCHCKSQFNATTTFILNVLIFFLIITFKNLYDTGIKLKFTLYEFIYKLHFNKNLGN